MQIAEPGDAAERVSNLSRAYRVNLTVLALVALFTGAFLVFSVLALSVAKRAQQFALLGVLGLTPRERLRLVLAESLVLGAGRQRRRHRAGHRAGRPSRCGCWAATWAAATSPAWRPRCTGAARAALVYGALGVLAALVGGWWPARAAQALPEAQTLKGLGAAPAGGAARRWLALLLIAAGALLAHGAAGVRHSDRGLPVGRLACWSAASRRCRG